MTTTLMVKEALEAPEIVARQLQKNKSVWLELYHRLQKIDIPFALTVARGSSDHAATYAKYLLETQLGLTTASAAPSVVTLYQSRQKLKNALVMALSQSGESPDICTVIATAREQGAITLALVNQENSSLAKIAEYVLPLYAGEEKAVAATKSYIAMLAAVLQGTAIAANNHTLLDCLQQLPELLHRSSTVNWSQGIHALHSIQDLLIIARGFGFPIALEAALKCKETAALHAEAFSTAEVQHGPLALIKPHFPVWFFCQNDVTLSGNIQLIKKMHYLGGQILLSVPRNCLTAEMSDLATVLPLPDSLHSLLDPLMSIQAFYLMIAELAVQRGFNPDQPANLQKITRTL